MARYWSRPQSVEATQWHLGDGPLAGSKPVGCAICGTGYAQPGFLNACLAPGQHDPVNHPHHLEVETARGTEIIFDGCWVVVLPTGVRKVYPAAEFEAMFLGLAAESEMMQTHPTFLVVCEKCGSTDVYFTNDLGYSPESGGWGSADLVCEHCGNRVELLSS